MERSEVAYGLLVRFVESEDLFVKRAGGVSLRRSLVERQLGEWAIVFFGSVLRRQPLKDALAWDRATSHELPEHIQYPVVDSKNTPHVFVRWGENKFLESSQPSLNATLGVPRVQFRFS